MAMSDCIKCWETPCCCGHEWRERDLVYLQKMHKLIGDIIKEKTSFDGDVMASTGKDIRLDNQRGD